MNKISRSKFIKLSLGSGVCMPPLLMNFNSESTARNNDDIIKNNNTDQLEFRFLQVNDMHIQAVRKQSNLNHYKRNKEAYFEANKRALWLIESLNEGNFFPKLDFILSVGDAIHGEDLEGIKRDLDYFQKYYYSKIDIPFYPVMGNHENCQNEGNLKYEEPFIQLFGQNKINYSYIYRGIHFIIFNNSGTWSVEDKSILNYRYTTLKKMLDQNPKLPKIICCHIPLIPLREKQVLAKSFGFSSYYTKEQEIVKMIDQYNVLAVLSGHLHLSGMIKRNNINHISLSGTASFPHDMGLFSVYKNRIEVEMIRIPSDLLEPETNIHGAKRFGRDFNDAHHPDYTTYIMGNNSERRFSTPL